MFLEVFLPALCVFVLAHWVSKPDNPGFITRWNPATYAPSIVDFLCSPWGEKKWAKVQASSDNKARLHLRALS